MLRFTTLLSKHEQNMHRINKQRQWWLVASSIVYVFIILLIFGWDWITNIHQKSLWWVAISIILIICINWWYWTMAVISNLLTHQQQEVEFIKYLIDDIKDIKDIHYLIKHRTTCNKTDD